MKTALVINTCRQPLRLKKVLASLVGQSSGLTEVLITEDGEDAETAQVVQTVGSAFACTVKHLSAPWTGQRVCEVRNRAFKHMTADHVVLLDGDCVAHPQFIADHRHYIREGYFVQGWRAAVKEPYVPGFSHEWWVRWSYLLTGRTTGRKRSVRALARLDFSLDYKATFACNQSYWAKDLRAVNGFDSDIVGWGADDYDIAGRLGVIGIKPLSLHGRALLYHLDHPRGDMARTRKNYEYADRQRIAGVFRCANGIAEAPDVRLKVVR